jgi:hypothetical protein
MKPPAAVIGYRLLCAWMSLCNLGFIALGFWVQTLESTPELDVPTETLRPLGVTLIFMGVVFGALNLYLTFVKPKPWFWVAGITNIVGGLLFCFPAALWLLLVWFRPEVKAHYETLDRKVL